MGATRLSFHYCLAYIYYLALSCCLIAALDAGTGLLEGWREESLLSAVLLDVGGREESLVAVMLLASEGEESLVAVFLFVGGREESIGAAALLSLSSLKLDWRKVDSCRGFNMSTRFVRGLKTFLVLCISRTFLAFACITSSRFTFLPLVTLARLTPPPLSLLSSPHPPVVMSVVSLPRPLPPQGPSHS